MTHKNNWKIVVPQCPICAQYRCADGTWINQEDFEILKEAIRHQEIDVRIKKRKCPNCQNKKSKV